MADIVTTPNQVQLTYNGAAVAFDIAELEVTADEVQLTYNGAGKAFDINDLGHRLLKFNPLGYAFSGGTL